VNFRRIARNQEFVMHRGTFSHELPRGRSQPYDSSAAFRFEVPERAGPQVV
jgi:hypothetical protein